MPRGLAIVNADVWTMVADRPRAEAVRVEDGRVAAVGEEPAILRQARRAGDAILDAAGQHVVPGLIDSHCHLVHQGLLAERVDLWDTTSKRQALARVAAALRRHRGSQPLLAERWDETRWKERAIPTRDELDGLSRRVPVILRRIDGHFAVGNTAACRDLKDRVPGVDETTGHLVEEASLRLNTIYETPVPGVLRALRLAQARALALGITGLHDFVVPAYLRGYNEFHRRGHLKLRVRATPYVETLEAFARTGLATGFGDERLSLGGVKVFADGSIGGHTAALTKPYADLPGDHRGRLNWGDATLASFVETAARSGLQPSIHAIGDAAIDQVLAAYASLGAGARRRLRPRIEHFEVHSEDHVRAAVQMGLVLSMQPNFVGEWSLPGGMYEQRFGDARRLRNNEFRRIHAAGARLAFGSDAMPLDPWFGLASCVGAPHASQRLPLEAALRSYTLGSAWGLGWERETGSLVPKKRADLVLARGDWRRPAGIRSTRVVATLVGGRWVSGRPPRAR